jgi:amidophosphoribosyltransferase
MPIEDLEEMAGGLPLCTACFTGNYPMDVPDGEIKDALE